MNIITRLSKVNVLVQNSDYNIGINPVAELIYGNGISRIIAYFDMENLINQYKEKNIIDLKKLTHRLFMKNCGSIDYTQLHQVYSSSTNSSDKLRASSFDLIFFLVPMEWDGGKGFDYQSSYFNKSYIKQNDMEMDGRKLLSKDGATWFKARNGYQWDNDGIYTNDYLSEQYDKFAQGQDSIVIARQHFDIGNEDINVDITDTVNKFIDGKLCNYGIGIAYSPMLEIQETKMQNYVGFFTNKTNTFFEPALISNYNDIVDDSRSNFCLNKTNRLYLYSNINGMLENLDEMPKCSISGKDYDVKQCSKGIYYIDVKLSSSDGYEGGTMYRDIWTNLKYNGDEIEDAELYFTTKPAKIAFNVGSSIETKPAFVLNAYGITNDEKIHRGDIRKIGISARVPYTNEECQLVDKMELRLYVKDGESEIDVFPFDKVNKSYLENYYMIDTSSLIPSTYYIDIRLNYNMEKRVHKDVLHFDVINDETHKYF